MGATDAGGPDRRVRGYRALAAALLGALVLHRLLLILGRPDLLHDLDAGELKHLDLALYGLPEGDGGPVDALRRFLSAPENIHHGGYAVVSALYAGLSAVFGHSLTLLRLLPLAALVGGAAAGAAFLRRRAGELAALLFLALMLGAPPIFVKWTVTARGGHTEAVLLAPLLALMLARALRTDGRGAWLAAGAAAGFSVYFTYLALPLAALLPAAALFEREARPGRGARVFALGAGLVLGFAPWLLGLLVLDLPYLDATIHASAVPEEAIEVRERGLAAFLAGLLRGLPHNLWPWTVLWADAPAYAAEVPDLLDYRPGPIEWAARAVVCLCAVGGGLVAMRRRSPLLLALCALPAVHHAFVLRLANQGGWPDVPHRYFIVAFPAVAAAAAVGASGLVARPARRAAVALLLLLAAGSLFGTGRWLRVPDAAELAAFDAARLRSASLGRVRAGEAAAVLALVEDAARQDPEHQGELQRGVGLVFPALADYYLLFRRRSAAPYPDRLFADGDPLSGTDGQRRALVRGAYAATRLKSDDEQTLRARVCSWEPAPDLREAVREVLAEELPDLRCPGSSREP